MLLIAGTSSSRHNAAFFVGLSENIGPVVDNSDVIFDRVVTNVGNAYDKPTGKFTAPADGVYQFNVVISAQGRQKVRLIRYSAVPMTHVLLVVSMTFDLLDSTVTSNGRVM